jgi:hypothetical protein
LKKCESGTQREIVSKFSGDVGDDNISFTAELYKVGFHAFVGRNKNEQVKRSLCGQHLKIAENPANLSVHLTFLICTQHKANIKW